jgi:hypothetical protein
MIPIPELASKTQEWPERARTLVIDSPEGYSYAAQLLTGIKALLKEIETSCSPVVKAALDAHRAALKQRRQLEEPLLDAEKTIKTMMAEYFRNQAAKRREDRRRSRQPRSGRGPRASDCHGGGTLAPPRGRGGRGGPDYHGHRRPEDLPCGSVRLCGPSPQCA